VSSFYSNSRRRTTRRFRTLTQAVDSLQEHTLGGDVVILPPDAGDSALDSDTEEPVDSQLDEEHLHEPAGEVEVNFIMSESDDDCCKSDKQPVMKKQKKMKQLKS